MRFIIGLALLLLGGCTCNNGSKSEKKFFRYNQASGLSSLDPAFAKDQATIWACNQLYNSLVQLDDNLEVKPAIAHSWQVSEDGLIYTFNLRTDVYFHPNPCFANSQARRATANDVVYSFSRIIDKKVASPGAWIFNNSIDTTQPFTALNDSTFQLRLLKPFRPMLGILSMQYCSVIPHEAVEKYKADFRANPVGTGPFKLVKWNEGTALILARHENYFEADAQGNKLPYLDGVKVTFIDNKKTEYLSFKQGNLDFINSIDQSYIDEVLGEDGNIKPELAGKFNLLKTPYLNTEYLGFLTEGTNEKENPFLNTKLRQAINYGFDRVEMLKYLRNGVGRPAQAGFTPYGLPSYTDSVVGYSYNPEKAKQLLAESGFNYKAQTLTLHTNETYKEYALFISKQLERIGLAVKVEVVQPAILREWMSQGKAQFFRGSWLADYPDAENYFAVFYSKNGSPPNYTRFKNARFDELYEQALAENNNDKRYAIYRQMEQIIIEQAPVVPLFYDEVLRFSQNNVSGLTPNALNLLNLKGVRLN